MSSSGSKGLARVSWSKGSERGLWIPLYESRTKFFLTKTSCLHDSEVSSLDHSAAALVNVLDES